MHTTQYSMKARHLPFDIVPVGVEFETTAALAPGNTRPAADTPRAPVFLGLDTASVGGNRNPSWTKARDQGQIRFAIIRASGGGSTDSVFKRDWPRIKEAGLVRGAYLFLQFPHPRYAKELPDPATQAQIFVRTVGALERTDLPPSLDVEFPGGRQVTGLSVAQVVRGVRAAWKVLKDHYGVAPIIYTSARVWREDLSNASAADLVESPLWLTPYPFPKGLAVIDRARLDRYRHDPPVPPPWGDATNWWIHQYQGDAVNLPGFATGNIDLNYFNTMAAGARGDRVKWVQRRLGISQSSTFDAATQAALLAFQARNGLAAVPIVDPRTFALLCWANP